MAAKWASPSSAVKTAPPIRAAPHRPVRIVPENHCAETRRRSTSRRCRHRRTAAARCRDRSRSDSPLGRYARALAVVQSAVPLNVAHERAQAEEWSRAIAAPRRHDWKQAAGTMPWAPHDRVNHAAQRSHNAVTLPSTAPPALRRCTPLTAKNGRGMWPECGAAASFTCQLHRSSRCPPIWLTKRAPSGAGDFSSRVRVDSKRGPDLYSPPYGAPPASA